MCVCVCARVCVYVCACMCVCACVCSRSKGISAGPKFLHAGASKPYTTFLGCARRSGKPLSTAETQTRLIKTQRFPRNRRETLWKPKDLGRGPVLGPGPGPKHLNQGPGPGAGERGPGRRPGARPLDVRTPGPRPFLRGSRYVEKLEHTWAPRPPLPPKSLNLAPDGPRTAPEMGAELMVWGGFEPKHCLALVYASARMAPNFTWRPNLHVLGGF